MAASTLTSVCRILSACGLMIFTASCVGPVYPHGGHHHGDRRDHRQERRDDRRDNRWDRRDDRHDRRGDRHDPRYDRRDDHRDHRRGW